MSFTYAAGGGKKHDIRLLIGDTDADALPTLRLEDEDIDQIIVLEGSLHMAAARAAEALGAKYARQAEGSAGPSRIQPGGRAMELRMLASRLRTQSAGLAIPSAGGISIASKAAGEGDTDRVEPTFRRGMLDHPDAV